MKVSPNSAFGNRIMIEDIDCYANSMLKSEKDEYVVHDGQLYREDLRKTVLYQGDLIHCVAYVKYYYKYNDTLPFIESKKSFDRQIRDLKKMEKKYFNKK